MALTPKQQAFVAEYLIDLNATQAAARAGYSKHTANEQGARLLANVSVRSAIDEAMAARAKRTHITQDRVLQELARLAFSDLRKAYNDDGTLKPPKDWDDDTAAAMAGVDTSSVSLSGSEDANTITTKKIKVFDKGAALTLAMKHLGMLTEKSEVTLTAKALPASLDDFLEPAEPAP